MRMCNKKIPLAVKKNAPSRDFVNIFFASTGKWKLLNVIWIRHKHVI